MDTNPPIDFSSFHLLHDVFRIRADDPIQVPLLAFPKSRAANFEYLLGKIWIDLPMQLLGFMQG